MRLLLYSPHPDTVLLLHSRYANSGQLLSTTAAYRLSRRGQLYEIGELDLAKVARLQKISASLKPTGKTLTYAQLVYAIRHEQGRTPRQWWRYDTDNRVVQHTSRRRLNQQGRFADTVIKYVYDGSNQLTGREHSVSSVHSPAQISYAVFSYLPSGMLQGKTSNARSEKPTFYRYLYQYYE